MNAPYLVEVKETTPIGGGVSRVTCCIYRKKRPIQFFCFQNYRTGLNLTLLKRRGLNGESKVLNFLSPVNPLLLLFAEAGQPRDGLPYLIARRSRAGRGCKSPTIVKLGGWIGRQDGRSVRVNGRDASGSQGPDAEGVLSLFMGSGEVKSLTWYVERGFRRIGEALPGEQDPVPKFDARSAAHRGWQPSGPVASRSRPSGKGRSARTKNGENRAKRTMDISKCHIQTFREPLYWRLPKLLAKIMPTARRGDCLMKHRVVETRLEIMGDLR